MLIFKIKDLNKSNQLSNKKSKRLRSKSFKFLNSKIKYSLSNDNSKMFITPET